MWAGIQKNLTDMGITKAAVETVAENTSDGVIAPLIFMTLFGGTGVFLYKAVNTMDSMVGYKNDRYLWFGRVQQSLMIWLTLFRPDYQPFSCWRLVIYANCFMEESIMGEMDSVSLKRDRFNHKSPNSAQTESACAGILQIELAGNAWYFGTLYEKPVIGDPVRPVEYEDILRANRLMTVTYILALIPVGILLFITF